MRCLGFNWSVRSDDAELVARVADLYAACRSADPPRHRFAIRRLGQASRAPIEILYDGRRARTVASVDLAVAHLAWAVNRGVVETTGDRLLLHAAAAACGADTLVLSGAQDSGKSTLIASLVRAGLEYVTDEIVAIDPEAATIDPYPKPIGLDVGIAGLLPDVAHAATGRSGPDHWLVGPQHVRRGLVARGPGTPRAVLVLEQAPHRPTALEPITRAEAVTALARHSFNFRTFGPTRLDVLARMLAGCACYRLAVGPLETATRAALDVLETVPTDAES